METAVWHTKDEEKAEWAPGPWQDEFDKAQWEDADTALPCLIVRGPSGALCGYVGVPEGHPWYRREYSYVDADAHGGLTFSSHCVEKEHGDDDESEGICHIPGPGDPDNVWWLGFDCAHGGDYMPRFEKDTKKSHDMFLSATVLPPSDEFRDSLRRVEEYYMSGKYRDVPYVKNECADLARQIFAAKDLCVCGCP